MSLVATRFARDAIVEACLAGSHRMLSPKLARRSGRFRRRCSIWASVLQQPDGQFSVPTGDAVVRYKTQHQHLSDGIRRGPGDDGRSDADRRISRRRHLLTATTGLIARWRERAGSRRIPDFTRADELARRIGGQWFAFDAESNWLPGPLQLALMQSLSAFSIRTDHQMELRPPQRRGVGPFDLYHYHLVLDRGGAHQRILSTGPL